MDGTLIEACASLKSFRPKDNRGDDDDGENFHGQKRSNETHASTTDPDARLYRKGKGKEAKLNYLGHIVTENRNGLIVDASVSEAGTRQEWTEAIEMLARQPVRPGQTVGADKGYDVSNFVDPCRALGFTPHVAARKYSRIDARTTRHAGYEISQRKRKRVEEPFGWMKSYGYTRQTAPPRSGICRLAVSIDRHGLQHYPIEEFGGTKRCAGTASVNKQLDRKSDSKAHEAVTHTWIANLHRSYSPRSII